MTRRFGNLGAACNHYPIYCISIAHTCFRMVLEKSKSETCRARRRLSRSPYKGDRRMILNQNSFEYSVPLITSYRLNISDIRAFRVPLFQRASFLEKCNFMQRLCILHCILQFARLFCFTNERPCALPATSKIELMYILPK